MTHNPIVIREIEKLSEMMEVEELQKEIWGVDDREVLPALVMVPIREVGGIMLGAFDADQLIGFVFAFPGFEQERPILHSDMLAVKTAYRSQGLGYRLKLAQRVRALEKGIDTITWTFDPLQSLNAHLNFGRLGVIAKRYHINFYGETTSFLHSTGTDRLWVTWQLNSMRVQDRIRGDYNLDNWSDSDIPNVLTIGEEQEPIPTPGISSSQFFLDIPGDINKLAKDDRDLALSWRLATREALTNALSSGFIVQDFYLIRREKNFGRYLLSSSKD